MHPSPESSTDPLSPNVSNSLQATSEEERMAERVHYLFRKTGNNPPARALEQQVLAYRLGRIEE